jgi:hypothetical protein
MGICAHLCRCIKASAAHDAVSSRKASATASRASGERGSNPKNGPAQPESAAAYLADVGCSHRRRMDAARASRSTHRHKDSPSRVGGRPAGTAPDGVAIPGPGTSGRQRRAPLYQMPRTSARASQNSGFRVILSRKAWWRGGLSCGLCRAGPGAGTSARRRCRFIVRLTAGQQLGLIPQGEAPRTAMPRSSGRDRLRAS